MLKLQKLVQNTPRDVRTRSKLCACRRTSSKEKLRGKKFLYLEQQYRTKCMFKFWKQTIRFHGDIVSKKTDVWVSCTCPYWKYYCETAVSYDGSTSLLYSNGEFPVIRNPKSISYLCKHLFACSNLITDRFASPADVTLNVLALLNHDPLTERSLRDALQDIALIYEVREALHNLILQRAVEQRGSEYHITPAGLALFAEMLENDQ